MEIQQQPPSDAPPVLPMARSNVPLPQVDNKSAVLYSDPEAVADIIKRKIDKELGDLKPKPPNIVQKTLRVIAYPLAALIGVYYARTETRKGIEDFMSANEGFNGMPHDLQSRMPKITGSADKVASAMQKHEENKNEYVRKFLGMPEKEPEGVLKKFMSRAERDLKSFKALSTEHKSKVVFTGLASLSVAMGLMLTLSDNKNFFSALVKRDDMNKDPAAPGRK